MRPNLLPFAIKLDGGLTDAAAFQRYQKGVFQLLTDSITSASVERIEPDIVDLPKMGRSFFRHITPEGTFTWNLLYMLTPFPHFMLTLTNLSGTEYTWMEGLSIPVFNQLQRSHVDVVVGYNTGKRIVRMFRPYWAFLRGQMIRGVRSRIYLYGKTMQFGSSKVRPKSASTILAADVLLVNSIVEEVCRERQADELVAIRFDAGSIDQICRQVDSWILSSSRASQFKAQLESAGVEYEGWFVT